MDDAEGMNWKEVYHDLKDDIMGRFDKQDETLVEIRSANKDGFREVHQRIDGIESRTKTLEDERDADAAVASARSRFHTRIAWIIAAVLVPLASTLIFVYGGH